jgi:transcriptional regulator with XRE-family HTH domain
MPAKSFRISVNPAVLSWARESAGYSVAEAAARIRQPERQLAAWESGQRHATWKTLTRLAKVYKRPVASLLLPGPPKVEPPPPDFRTLPNGKTELSPKTRFAIRTARWLARQAAELAQQLGRASRFPAGSLTLSMNPETAAEEVRDRLGVSLARQLEWANPSQAFKEWRQAIEAQDAFVFQFGMPLEEARGFSLLEQRTPALVVNKSDAVAGRVFTLFHEYAHLLLAKPGICIPGEGHARSRGQSATHPRLLPARRTWRHRPVGRMSGMRCVVLSATPRETWTRGR